MSKVKEENVKMVREFLKDKSKKILEVAEGRDNLVITKIPYAGQYELLYATYSWCYTEEDKARGRINYPHDFVQSGVLDTETGEVFDVGYRLMDYIENYKLENLEVEIYKSYEQEVHRLYENGELAKRVKSDMYMSEIDIEYRVDNAVTNLYVERILPELYKFPVPASFDKLSNFEILESRKPEFMKILVNEIVDKKIESGSISKELIEIYELTKERLAELYKVGNSYIDTVRDIKMAINGKGYNTVKITVKTDKGTITVPVEVKGINTLNYNRPNDYISTWYIVGLQDRHNFEQIAREIYVNDIVAISYRGKNIFERKVA